MNEELVAALKELLADEYSLYFKAQGYHWNVEGHNFSAYHDFFGEIYEDVYGMIDPLAEHIRALGAYAPFKMSRMVELTSVPDTEVDTSCESMTADLYASFMVVIGCISKCAELANQAREYGLMDTLGGMETAHKKWAWQLRSSLKA